MLRWIAVVTVSLAGCASLPPGDFSQKTIASGEEAAAYATTQIGRPYRYGGATPERGFDCSGLVQWSFGEAGVRLPRGTEAQRRMSRPVAASALRPGDLLFFNLEEKKNSHVGIYAGDGLFVHAPSTGKNVRRDRLETPYWRKHLSETRRLAL